MEKKKSVWDYFTKNTNSNANCNSCGKILKCVGGSTSGLHAHLKSQHKINLREKNSATETTSGFCNSTSNSSHSSTQSRTVLSANNDNNHNPLTKYFKKVVDDSLAAVVSRMVARDGFPLQKFISSYDLRIMLTSNGYSLPKSVTSIKLLVMNYGDKIRDQIRQDMLTQLKENRRFSLTFDEWTSIRNRRYININVHSTMKIFYNLGLVRLQGSGDARNCLQLIESRLKEFSISFNDIVAITTDGAAVMKKLGTHLEVHHQLCFAHGIQLAVMKILYKKENNQANNTEQESEENESDDTEDEEDLAEGFQTNLYLNGRSDITNEDILPLITKIRRTVRSFRRSPTKNEILQKHVTDEFGKELCLKLDSRTRWSSLLDMVERFYQLKVCVQKSFIDLHIDIIFTENEFQLTKSLIEILQPVRLAVEALSANDCTLLKADTIHTFMINELTAQSNSLSQELKTELILRIQERRTNLSDVLQFLHNPSAYRKMYLEDSNSFIKLTEAAIVKLIVSLVERLNMKHVENEPEDSTPSTSTSTATLNNDMETIEIVETKTTDTELANFTMKERLFLAINEIEEKSVCSTNSETIIPASQLTKLIKKEIIGLKDEDHKRGKYLTFVYNYLLTVKPSSVEAERAFSSAGTICTKIRSRLNDKTLDTICFLRAYFNSINYKFI